MRKLIIGAVTVLAVLLCAPAAAEAAPPNWTPVDDIPTDLPAARCGFPIQIGIVANNEYKLVTTLPGGATVKEIKGKLVLSFTNTDPITGGKTIVRNVSGPTTTTTYPDGSGLFEGTGNNWLSFGPNGQANTGEPGLVFTSGKVTVTFASFTATGFTLNGHQENGCDLLK